MKKIVLIIILLLFTTISLVAQNNERNRIKALKTAFISNALELTSKEAEKFWPIYNNYDKNIHEIRTVKMQQIARKIKLAGGIDNLSEADSEEVLKEFINIDFNIANEKKKLYKNLTGIISSKKMIKLVRAEQNFNKELLKQFRERRKINSPNRN
ncbi:MAG: sensor of ECF-type sigma factor [Flavobacteriaceae bacterium]|nr:sensor of ECF-type sigma factor [Flavobacteriaceae bacterium]